MAITPLPTPTGEAFFDPGQITKFRGVAEVNQQLVKWELQTPEHLVFDGLVCFIPGFSGIYGSSEAPVSANAQAGMVSLRLQPVRRGKSLTEDLAAPQQAHVDTIEAVTNDVQHRLDIRRQAPNMSEVDLSKKVLEAHSMGMLAATMYANQYPSKTFAVMSKAGCGFGHPKHGELLIDIPRGAAAGLRHDLLPTIIGGDIPANLRSVRELAAYWRLPRVISEARSCTSTDVAPLVSAARDHGVLVTHQAYQHDVLVRPDSSIADNVDHYEVMDNTGHMAPIRKAQRVAQSILRILGNLQTVNH